MAGSLGARHFSCSTAPDPGDYLHASVNRAFSLVCDHIRDGLWAVFSCSPLPTVPPQSQGGAPPTLVCENGALTREHSKAMVDAVDRPEAERIDITGWKQRPMASRFRGRGADQEYWP